MLLWDYVRRGWAERMWGRWYQWAIRSRLEPMQRVARMIKKHWEGVINAATSDVTNARAESINSRVQWPKRMACGFRNRENFRNAIYCYCIICALRLCMSRSGLFRVGTTPPVMGSGPRSLEAAPERARGSC